MATDSQVRPLGVVPEILLVELDVEGWSKTAANPLPGEQQKEASTNAAVETVDKRFETVLTTATSIRCSP